MINRKDKGMLVLSRMEEEEIMIGDDVTIKVVHIQRGKVRLGITAPKDVPVHRREIFDKIRKENEDGSKA